MLAYDTARKASTALVARQGMRTKGTGHHVTVEAVVRAQSGGPSTPSVVCAGAGPRSSTRSGRPGGHVFAVVPGEDDGELADQVVGGGQGPAPAGDGRERGGVLLGEVFGAAGEPSGGLADGGPGQRCGWDGPSVAEGLQVAADRPAAAGVALGGDLGGQDGGVGGAVCQAPSRTVDSSKTGCRDASATKAAAGSSGPASKNGAVIRSLRT